MHNTALHSFIVELNTIAAFSLSNETAAKALAYKSTIYAVHTERKRFEQRS